MFIVSLQDFVFYSLLVDTGCSVNFVFHSELLIPRGRENFPSSIYDKAVWRSLTLAPKHGVLWFWFVWFCLPETPTYPTACNSSFLPFS